MYALFNYSSKSKNANEFINDEEILKTISQVQNGKYSKIGRAHV